MNHDRVSVRFALAVLFALSPMGAMPLAFGEEAAATKPATPEKELKQLLDAIIAHVDAPAPEGLGRQAKETRERDADTSRGVVEDIRTHVAHGQLSDATRQADNLSRELQTDAFKKDWAKVAVVLKQLTANVEAAVPGEMRQLMEGLPKLLAEAKTKEDVKKLLTSVSGVRDRYKNSRVSMHRSDEIEELSYKLELAESGLKNFSSLIDAQASGNVHEALRLATDLMKPERAAFATKSLQERYETVKAACEKEEEEQMGRWREEFSKVKDSKAILKLAATVEARIRNDRDGEYVNYGGIHLQVEAARLRMWVQVQELETESRLLAAQHVVQELLNPDRAGGEAFGWGSRSPQLLTRKTVEAKNQDLTAKLIARGDVIIDPNLKKAADAIAGAKSYDDLIQATDQARTALSLIRSGDRQVDDKKIYDELTTAAEEGKLLAQMNQCVDSREWGRVWQLNTELTTPSRRRHDQSPHRWGTVFTAQRLAVLRRALKENPEVKLKLEDAKKPLDQGLLEEADGALAAEDYRRASVILTTYLQAIHGVGMGDDDMMHRMQPDRDRLPILSDLLGVRMYAQALDFEKAGDFVSAAERCGSILRLTGQRVPAAKATEKLASLIRAHKELAPFRR